MIFPVISPPLTKFAILFSIFKSLYWSSDLFLYPDELLVVLLLVLLLRISTEFNILVESNYASGLFPASDVELTKVVLRAGVKAKDVARLILKG